MKMWVVKYKRNTVIYPIISGEFVVLSADSVILFLNPLTIKDDEL